jgi:hypothetical protein
VTAVLTILAGLAVPSMYWVQSIQGDMVAARLRSALVHAQQWAMGSGNATWIDFELNKNLAALYVEDPDQPGKANRSPLLDPLAGGPMVVVTEGAGVSLVSAQVVGGKELKFDAHGAPYGGNGKVLKKDAVLKLSDGTVLRVTAGTGLISVE